MSAPADDPTDDPTDDASDDAAASADPSFVDIDRGLVRWRIDAAFLTSNWTCLYGRGCKGILPAEAEELSQGCCSLGAHFGPGPDAEDEAMQLSAFAALIPEGRWQHRAAADDELGVFGDEERTRTRVVDGACIFLNRPGFDGGDGCALHLAALDAGESPVDWKPSVCWQLPLHVDYQLADDADPDGPEIATVRRWGREQWGETGDTMAWCCTERADGGEAYVGESRVIDSMADELTAIVGDEVMVELRRRLDDAIDTDGGDS